MADTIVLKLPKLLKNRIARLAGQTGRTAQVVMLDALEREISRQERMWQFVRQAMEADVAIEAGAEVYGADDVHRWLEGLCRGGKVAVPRAKRARSP